MLTAKVFEVDSGHDAVEFCYARGWTDGLPVVPPTEDRVLRMLARVTTNSVKDTVKETFPAPWLRRLLAARSRPPR